MSQQKPNRTSDDTYKRRLFYDNGIRFVEVNGRMTGEYNPPTPILKVAANVNIQSSSSFINKISIHPMLRFNHCGSYDLCLSLYRHNVETSTIFIIFSNDL